MGGVESADLGLIALPLLAGILVLATHVPLGMRVLDRGIVFIDLAIAQIAGLGVIAAGVAGLPDEGVAVQVAAACSALAGAALLSWAERHAGRHQEALIGITFVLAASAGSLLLAGNPHGGEHLQELLVGQILWARPATVASLGVVTGLLIVLLGARVPDRIRPGGTELGFYVTFALAVTASVQVVGVYLVFASLIIPALATRALTGTARLVVAGLVGLAGYALGLLGSLRFDVPAGAMIVCALAAVGAVCALVLSRWRGSSPESAQRTTRV